MVIYFQNISHDLKNKIALLPKGCVITKELTVLIDFIWWCPKDKFELEEKFVTLKNALQKDGLLWVSWHKKSSGVETDLGENLIREIGLKNEMVDVKVIAVNELYSGLKFVFKPKDR